MTYSDQRVDRPLTALYAVAARWRELSVLPQWRLEIVWEPGLAARSGENSVLSFSSESGLATIAVEPLTDDDGAERALHCALTELLLIEQDARMDGEHVPEAPDTHG